MRRRLLVAALVAGAAIAPVPAWAYWALGSTSAAGAAQAGSLGAPTISVAMNNGDVRISVTAAPSGGLTPTSYRVDRTVLGVTTPGICTITGSTGFCQDSSPSVLTNTYRVVARHGSWSAIGAASQPTASIVPPVLGTAFSLTVPATAVAGTSFPVTIRATGMVAGAPVTDATYSGTHTFSLTGATAGPNGTAPTLPGTATFTNGVATVNVTLVNVGSTSLTIAAGTRTGSSSAIAVSAGTPAAVAWTGVTAPIGAVSQIDASTYQVTGTGNNGVASGALTLVDAFGNPATAVGAGWTLTLGATSDRPGDVGAFKVGATNGTNGQPLTVNFPSSGPATLAFTYTHNGNPDWADVLTVTAAKNGVAVSPSLTINLYKTSP